MSRLNANSRLVQVAEIIRDECVGDNKRRNWNKACTELKRQALIISNARELALVKYFGSLTIRDLQKKWDILYPGMDFAGNPRNDAPGFQSLPKPKKKTGRAPKRSRQEDMDPDDVEDFSAQIDAAASGSQTRPAAKRRAMGETFPTYNDHPDARLWVDYGVPIPGSGFMAPRYVPPELPGVQPWPHQPTPAPAPVAPAPPALQPRGFSGFGFWYLDDQDRHVRTCNEAFIDMDHVRWKIEYLRSQRNHPWATANIRQQSDGKTDTYYGFLDQECAETHLDCPGFERPASTISEPRRIAVAPVHPAQRDSTAGWASNAELQADLAKAKKRTVGSNDPSRQVSQQVLDVLNGASLRKLTRSSASASTASSSGEPSHLGVVLSDSSGRSEAQIRRDRMAQAALNRMAGLSSSFVDLDSASPAIPPSSTMPPRPSAGLLKTTSTPAAPNIHMPPPPMPLTYQTVSHPRPHSVLAKEKLRRPRVSNHLQPLSALWESELEPAIPQQSKDHSSPLAGGSDDGDQGQGRSELAHNCVYKTDHTTRHAYQQPFTPQVYKAGSYVIKLIIDNREVRSSKGKANREAFWKALQRKEVLVEQRALAVGDVAWVATKKYADASGGPEECVLDFILERKRLDDLISSVMDGRFHEQKFRLKQTAIGRVYYLIEHHHTKEKRERWNQQIDTALSSTQVVDGFMVKETRDMNETIEYLTVMHKMIVKMHQDRDLYIIPDTHIRRHSYMALQEHLRETQPENVYHTSYETFKALNDKSGQETLKNCWTRMLLCVTGFSAEKVARLLEMFDTPKALWDAFQEAEKIEEEERGRKEREREQGKGKGRQKKSKVPLAKHLLTRMTEDMSGRKKIGPALSEKLYNLFRADVYGAD
ncbi:Crossover junction endonuclease mus81 [Tulasnella sp. JGI-2019a]|nr:Crossover junction endonuclease mus81 [Tulasnella sp. JGI-2019a]